MTIFRETLKWEAILGPRGQGELEWLVPRLVWCIAEAFVLFCDAGCQTVISQTPKYFHQWLIYIGATAGEIKHKNMGTDCTFLPTRLGRNINWMKLHSQLNFMRLQLEVEQNCQADKSVKWCIFLFASVRRKRDSFEVENILNVNFMFAVFAQWNWIQLMSLVKQERNMNTES